MCIYVVEFIVRGWVFRTLPMSKASADECLQDFKHANPTINFAATIIEI